MSLQLHSAPFPLLSVIFRLLTLTARTLGHEHRVVRVVVKEGSNVFLPCSLSTKENIAPASFQWKKEAERDQRPQEVFLYDAGIHHNNGRPGQSDQFRGRVSYFPDELKHGNASIVIRNTQTADSGNYTCGLPRLRPPETFYIELVVVAAPKPFVTALDATETWSLLQCEVQGASPRPKVRWQDSDGNQLPAEGAQVSDRGSSYDITLNILVNKTGRYLCVVEQEDIKHQVTSETFVHINKKDSSSKVSIRWLAFTFLSGVVIALAVGALLVFFKCIPIRLKNSPQQQRDGEEKPSGRREEDKWFGKYKEQCYLQEGQCSREVPSEAGDFVESSPSGSPEV